MFSRYIREHEIDPDTPVVVLPPRSRYEPATSIATDGPQLVEDITEEVIFEAGGRPPQPPRQAFGPSGAGGSGGGRGGPGRPNAPGRLTAPPNGAMVTMRPASARRPQSARTTGGSVYASSARRHAERLHVQQPVAAAGRPGSAPGEPGAGGLFKLPDERRKEAFALWTPGEEVLKAPALTPLGTSSTGSRRPAAEELQYELTVTAGVLRAAQTRLSKEREARQLARVGEELALVDLRNAREEQKALQEERRNETRALANQVIGQRKELEDELKRLESDQEVSRLHSWGRY